MGSFLHLVQSLTMSRSPLAFSSESRDALRQRDSWAVNVYVDGQRARKRPGFGTKVSGTTPGQGLFNWTGSIVSIQNDILHVGAGTYSL